MNNVLSYFYLYYIHVFDEIDSIPIENILINSIIINKCQQKIKNMLKKFIQ